MTAAGSAHLTAVNDAARPTIFEILSHEGFAHALKPAAFHVIRVLAEQSPTGLFGSAYRYFDELYLSFDAVVQWHYILTRGATLSEAFYGLERQWPTAKTKDKLTRIRLSYLVSILLPYISSKLENYYKKSIEAEGAHLSNITESKTNTLTKQLKYNFLQWYEYLKAILRVINLCYLLRYTFGRTEHHNLTFKLLKMTLGYTSEERSKFIEEKNAELWVGAEWRHPKKLPKLILRSLGESVLFAVEIGTFFIQFLEWWHNDEKRARITVSSLPIPPAPHTLKDNANVQHLVKLLPSDSDKCPICRKEFRNPTVISISGVVYCYSCIFPRISIEGACPLTNLRCNLSHLIRIYQ